MIAQTIAARHPEPGALARLDHVQHRRRRAASRALRIYPVLLRPAPRGREAFIEHMVSVFELIGSPDLPRIIDDIRDAGWDQLRPRPRPAGPGRQLAAIIASGDRTADLRRITAIPTLVIHGTADPLVSTSGGRATAKAIPGAQLMSIEGMGHDLPRAMWPRLIDAIGPSPQRR
jgi:pimeloyl-ACP methyl ester carboxylesterase